MVLPMMVPMLFFVPLDDEADVDADADADVDADAASPEAVNAEEAACDPAGR